MAARRRRNRSSGKIDRMPEHLRDTVNQMLLNGFTYREIVAYLKDNGQELSQMSVQRYAEKYLATVEMLQISQANFKLLAEEVEKCPDLDFSEVGLRIASQQMLNALTSAQTEQWEEVAPDKIVKNLIGLTRAISYKRKTDLELKTEQEAALDANKTLLYEVLKKHPDLYKQVMEVVKEEQALLDT
jgi:hypothetical protein